MSDHLKARPLTRDKANELVKLWHRHHKPVQGYRFAIGAFMGERPVGAVIVGRPVARMVDQYAVAEVTRLVTDGTRNACSFLYARAAQACAAMGFARIQTYIMIEEPGTSLRAVGWVCEGVNRRDGVGWDGRVGRQVGLFESDSKTTGVKVRWARELGGEA